MLSTNMWVGLGEVNAGALGRAVSAEEATGEAS